VLDHARAERIETVWAVMWAHNEASAVVDIRAGMTDLGVLDDPWYGTAEDPKSRMFRIDLAD
jgi:RimJ/RimL family protein N-acetyltransferase